MYLFHNDYNQACLPEIMTKLSACSGEQCDGYGMDDHCARAAALIRNLCEDPSLAVHFLVGGTQTNLIVTAASLRPHQALICAESGHVFVHETGAIEATGHKVVSLPSRDGKITADQLRAFLQGQKEDANAEHNVQGKMVYISNPTELGTTYSRDELAQISTVCRENGLYLFMDGARLGYALTASDCDITLADIAKLCDVFYIGGTKLGALFGEAVVISNPIIAEDFRYLIKQRGGLLAKGWLLGLQYEALFEDGLYFTAARHANKMADRLRSTLAQCGYSLYVPGTTNQVFAVLPDPLLSRLANEFTFMLQEKLENGYSAVRFCTSWATTEQSIDALCSAIYGQNNE